MKFLIVLLAMLLATPLAAQTVKPSTGDPFESLKFLEGTWDAKAAGNGGVSAAGTYTFETELAGRILARHSTNAAGCNGPATFDCEHGDLLYVYRDGDGRPLKAIYFDNEGHVVHYDVSTPNPTTAVFLSDPTLPGPQFRLTYELDAAIMSGAFEVRPPGQDSWHAYLKWSGPKHVGS